MRQAVEAVVGGTQATELLDGPRRFPVLVRFPELKLEMTEVRLDWIPATFTHLDAVYDQHRDSIPATRRPSEYWRSNCAAGASFGRVFHSRIAMRRRRTVLLRARGAGPVGARCRRRAGI